MKTFDNNVGLIKKPGDKHEVQAVVELRPRTSVKWTIPALRIVTG